MTSFDALTYERQLPLLLALAEQAMTLYDVPENVTVKLINLSENATYKVEAPDGRRWALRIHRDGYHSKTAIASELAWLMELRRSGIVTTPLPIKGCNGEIIQIAKLKHVPSPRHVVLFDWETGVEPVMGAGLLQPFTALGEVTARMHQQSRAWQRPFWFQRLTWDFETSLGEARPHWGRWREGIGVGPEQAKIFSRTVALIGQRLAAYGKGSSRFGLIHGDLRLANLLIDDDSVKVIDFDDSGFSWFMYDAATPVSFYEHDPQVPELIEHWKMGYRRVCALSKADEAEIPTFIMLRRLLLVAWIGSRRETDLAKSMGLPYTEGSVALCDNYLKRFS